MTKNKNLEGQKFGRWTVIKRVKNRKADGHAYWLCKCECGEEAVVRGTTLRNGESSSCGCYAKELSSTHNMSNTRLFHIWQGMKARIQNTNKQDYRDYGGRGITICQEWLDDFMNFYNWAMANGYSDELTIDRIDVNGDYCPENCRWATNLQQARNKRNNHFITENGETHCLSEWAEILEMSTNSIRYRLNRGLKLCKT